MIERCYKRRNNNKSYEKCWVIDKWRYLSGYKEWFDENYVDGFVLDKDILVPGNKMYGPSTCLFVPREINELFISTGNDNTGLPRGVSFVKRLNKYCAQVSMKGASTKYVGLYDTIEEARQAYVDAKTKHVERVAYKYFSNGIMPKNTYQAIINHKF